MTRIAALQLSSQADVLENLSVCRGLLQEVAEEGAQVVLLPEGFAFLGSEKEKAKLAEEWGAGGPIQDFLREEAARLGITLIAGGLPEKSPEAARPYNSSVVVGPDGERRATYRKIHLFDVNLADGTRLHESAGTTPGTEPAVVDVGEWRYGLSICYDVRFPELYAEQCRQGAQVLTIPAAFTQTTGEAHWHILLRARAIETQCYVVAAAQWGTHPRGRKTFGHTLVIDPWGQILAEKSEGLGWVCASLDATRQKSIREQMPLRR